MVKSRRRAASSNDIDGSPCDLEALVPAAGLRFAARQRDVDRAELVDREAWPTASTRPMRQQRRQLVLRDAEDFDVEVLRRRGRSSRSRTKPPTTSARPPRPSRGTAVGERQGERARHSTGPSPPNRSATRIAESASRRDVIRDRPRYNSAAMDTVHRLLRDLVAIDSVNPSLVPGAAGEAAIAAPARAGARGDRAGGGGAGGRAGTARTSWRRSRAARRAGR